jgi:hypothetical protein
VKSQSIKPGGLVVTQRQLSKAFETYSAQVTHAVKLIEDRQTEFEDEVRKALLAVEHETTERVLAILAARKKWWQVWR